MNTTPRLRASSLVRDTRGANMVEYIIIAGLVALIAVAGFKKFGESIRTKVQNQGAAVDGVNDKAQQ